METLAPHSQGAAAALHCQDCRHCDIPAACLHFRKMETCVSAVILSLRALSGCCLPACLPACSYNDHRMAKIRFMFFRYHCGCCCCCYFATPVLGLLPGCTTPRPMPCHPSDADRCPPPPAPALGARPRTCQTPWGRGCRTLHQQIRACQCLVTGGRGSSCHRMQALPAAASACSCRQAPAPTEQQSCARR